MLNMHTIVAATSLGRNVVLVFAVSSDRLHTRLHILHADVRVARNNTDRDVSVLSRGTVLRS